VPFFLLVTMHGAKELGLSVQEYFSRAENVAEGQLRMRAKYRHDCLYGFFYAPIEVESWGGEVIFHDDGPANSSTPFMRPARDQEPGTSQGQGNNLPAQGAQGYRDNESPRGRRRSHQRGRDVSLFPAGDADGF
jgi:hypothetical protein